MAVTCDDPAPRFLMRVPFKTETDALRVALALGLLIAASVLVGWLTSREYGIVLFAAGVAAGVGFELSGREPAGLAALREAARAPHPHGPTGETRHVLVVAGAPLGGEELRQALESAGEAVELDVLAPTMASPAHRMTSDIDRERDEARKRLDASLAWAAEHGFAARGEVGDPDPLVAIEDELRDFGADEIIVVRHPSERASWLATRMLGHLARELDVPVHEIHPHDDDEGAPAGPQSDRGRDG
jgi:hypothetical protein